MDNASGAAASPTVVVVTGGDPPDPALPSLVPWVPPGARVVAADSGANAASTLGLTVHDLVGDLDSVSRPVLDALTAAGTSIRRHEADKDATDLELALQVALADRPAELVVLGGLGGRVDHELANVQLLAAVALTGVDVVLRSGRATVHFVRPGWRPCLRGTIGEVVSLVPASGPVHGVTTEGLRWPLVDALLTPGTTVGISNELVAHDAAVACTDGVLLVIQAGVAAAAVAPRTKQRNVR